MSDDALKVLIVDDERAVVQALELLFDLHDIPTLAAHDPDEALAALAAHADVGVVVQDMNFGADRTSGEEGRRLFDRIRESDPQLPVLLITAWASLEMAVRLVKEGAADYMAKPWDDDKLVIAVRNLLRMRRLQLENDLLRSSGAGPRRELAERYDLCGIVYRSEALHRAVSLAVNVARSDAPVLVTGPSGAGKEKLAEIVQANSRRRDRPFLRVNVGALPAELLEAELFGAEAGAFTGATSRRVGRFEAADGGTLFLDELDALPLDGQVKLLRVVQTGEFQRLGSSVTRTADVRLISATNADLASAVGDGRFREDLFYRLNVIELVVPPLRERPEDVLPLAEHFLRRFEEESGRPLTLTPGAEAALVEHPWDGNVRELENRVRRAALTGGDGGITAGDLDLRRGDEPRQPAALNADGLTEKREVERALLAADGVVARAAERLGVSRQALYRKMERLGVVLERRPR